MSPSPAVPALGPEWEQVVKPPPHPPTAHCEATVAHSHVLKGPALCPAWSCGQATSLLHRLRPSGVSLL